MRRALLLAVPLLLVSCGNGAVTEAECQAPSISAETEAACLTEARERASEALASETASAAPDAPGTSTSTAEDDAAVEDPYGELGPSEGPLSDGPHQWPDGVTAELVSVDTALAYMPDDPAADTEVRVTTRFTNSSPAPLPLGEDPTGIDGGPTTTLFYGVDRYEAQGYYNEDNVFPTMLSPGSSAEWVAVFHVPSGQLDALAFSVSPDDVHVPWTFTGVEALV